MDEDADDLERLVRKGIRRVRLEDDAQARARTTQPSHSTVLHTTVSHTVVSHASAQTPHARAGDHAAASHANRFAQLQNASTSLNSHKLFSKFHTTAERMGKFMIILFAAAVFYFVPLVVRGLLTEDDDIDVTPYQYLMAILFFTCLHYLSSSHLAPPTSTCHPHIKQCDIITLLKMEKENLNRNLAVCMDRQYSFYHYPQYHIPLSTILADIDFINQELLQVELLLLKLGSGNCDKEYEVILGKVVSKYGIKM